MKFNHIVKHDGKFYPAGTEVPMLNDGKPIKDDSGKVDAEPSIAEKVKTSGKASAKK